MKVLIFGGTGETGKQLVTQCLACGFQTTIFTRDPTHWKGPDRVQVIKGDVRNATSVSKAIEGQDWILSALGADSLGKTDLLERGAENIVAGMKAQGVRRVVVLGAAGTQRNASKYQPVRLKLTLSVIRKTFLRHAFRDSARQERVYQTSDLDYTVVHPPRLVNRPAAASYRELPDAIPPRGASISRADVAEFMVKILPDKTYYGAGPYIAD